MSWCKASSTVHGRLRQVEYSTLCRLATAGFTAALLFAAFSASATANPVAVPYWSYWTNVQAGKNVVRANPQRIDFKGHKTTVTDAACKGTGAAKSGRYRAFACAIHYRDDTLDCCSFGTTLYVTSSKVKRGAVACWSRSSAALARGECRPPKVGG